MAGLLKHRLRYARVEWNTPLEVDAEMADSVTAGPNYSFDAVRVRIELRNSEGCFMPWADMTPDEADALASDLAESAALVREQTTEG